MSDREFDIVVYGATGFTGRRAAHYIAQNAGADIRFAFAGRDRAKLEALAATLGDVPVIVAEANDRDTLAALAARTRVVLAMAGPFSLYADVLVDACVRSGTHYADITGETPWVATLIDRHHETAAAAGTRIVPCCGFDSVPSDLGTFFLVRAMQQQFGADPEAVKAFFQISGGFNGGTLATLLLMSSDPVALAAMRRIDLLTPPQAKAMQAPPSRDPTIAAYDGDADGWTAPFVMGPINTRIVRRSAGLFALGGEPYGERFSYQEYMKFPGPLGAALATTVAAGTAFTEASLGFAPARNVLAPLLPKPGTGPSEASIENGWYRVELVGRTPDGRVLRATLADTGDPSNAATVKFSCEAARALAQDPGTLPGGAARGGILTPATALGDVLVARLRNTGMRFDLTIPAE